MRGFYIYILNFRMYTNFVHLSIILIVFKEKEKNSFPQDIFDNIFLSIEYHIRELGYGDVAVNKKMKLLLRIFYDVLLKVRSTQSKKKINKAILAKYLEPQNTNPNQLNCIINYIFLNFSMYILLCVYMYMCTYI